MYADLLKEKLAEQEKIYRLFQAGQTDCVFYREVRDGEYGIRDGNEINRRRLPRPILTAFAVITLPARSATIYMTMI